MLAAASISYLQILLFTALHEQTRDTVQWETTQLCELNPRERESHDESGYCKRTLHTMLHKHTRNAVQDELALLCESHPYALERQDESGDCKDCAWQSSAIAPGG